MRDLLSIKFPVRRFGVWRAAVLVAAALAATTLLAWAAAVAGSNAPPADPFSRHAALVAGAGLLAVVWLARGLWRVEAGRLAVRGGGWTFVADRVGSGQPVPVEHAGSLGVAVDLGSFVLLRFVPGSGGRARWLPLQRRGLEREWHAIRVALYAAPRPAAGADAGGQAVR